MATSPPVRPDIPVPADQSPLEYLKRRMDDPNPSASDQLTLADVLKDARFFSNAFNHTERVAALRYGYDKLFKLEADVARAEFMAFTWKSDRKTSEAEREARRSREVSRQAMMEDWKATMGIWERKGKEEEGDVEEFFAAQVLALVKDREGLDRELDAVQ
ncbi:hypothetical protein LTR85_006957 [Meristemomyces frigidus]|nr:hypothetical protein LTR85_006957 [Meristemomyces frigidus]